MIAGEARAGEAKVVERPGNFLPPNIILGMKRVEGTEKPAEAFGAGSTAVVVGIDRFPGVGVPGELEVLGLQLEVVYHRFVHQGSV